MTRVFVGTSGWTYSEWRGVFYPPLLKQRDLLGYYAGRFPTVEINTTFYRVPSRTLVEGWERRTPEDFLFSVKAPRLLTHMKRLKVSDPVFSSRFQDFLSRIAPLQGKKGAVLFQLPPHMKADLTLLEEFLHFLGKGSWAIEFRHGSWFQDSAYSLARKYGVAVVVVGAPEIPFIPVATAPVAYVRLHGTTAWYDYRYSFDELRDIALQIQKMASSGSPEMILCYFDNDPRGYAVENAATLLQIVRQIDGLEVA